MLGVPRDGELRDDDVRGVAQYVMDRADSATSAERLVLAPCPTLRRFVIAELGWHNIGGRFDFG